MKIKRIKWELTFDKFLTKDEVKRLRNTIKSQRNRKNNHIAWMEWMLSEFGLNTGLRVEEMADLWCMDIKFRDEYSCVHVRDGKCHKSRHVLISKSFCKKVQEYLEWKRSTKESTEDQAPFFYSRKSKGAYSTRALQLAFKRTAKRANIDEEHSIHHLRHTYATMLLESSNNNLIFVKDQLGHSDVSVTETYAKVQIGNKQKALEKLFPE